MKQEIADETGLGCINVVAVGSHDTASAVFAVPSNEPNRAYLSSGTWSLLGAEVDQPILTEEARVAGFTNEGGIQGKIRFLQNITGLWILQRLMAEWKEQGKEISYDCAIAEATASDIRSVIDVDDSAFAIPTIWKSRSLSIVISTIYGHQSLKENLFVALSSHWHIVINWE